MLIILAQRKDTESVYDDTLFVEYQYPGRYRNAIHTGDHFVYYQGDRCHKEQRYYYGCGTIGKITLKEESIYYAELLDCKQFTRKVPIYCEKTYYEKLDYQEVRIHENPPWQSSIRPISKRAYSEIMKVAGDLIPPHMEEHAMEEELKDAIGNYYLSNDKDALKEIARLSAQLIDSKDKSK